MKISEPTISYPTYHRGHSITVNRNGSFGVAALGIAANSVLQCMQSIDKAIAAEAQRYALENSEVWFEIEYSIKGANGWFSANTRADTAVQINRKMEDMLRTTLEFRVVRKTVTTEIVVPA